MMKEKKSTVSDDHLYKWKKKSFIENPWLRYGFYALIIAYLIYAFGTLSLDFDRVLRGIPRAQQIFASAFPPNFAARGWLIVTGFIESIQITVLATILGVLLSIPFGLMAAKNIVIKPVYVFGRAVIIITRSLHAIVLGVLFVKAVGFGAFAGILTLIVTTVGFVGKLIAEDVEEIDFGQIEALRSTGAGYFSILAYAVFPQIKPRLIGLTLYQFDINLRASTVIGLVGAGGIGNTLNSAFGRYDYGTASAIILVMIAVILVVETISSKLRRFTK